MTTREPRLLVSRIGTASMLSSPSSRYRSLETISHGTGPITPPLIVQTSPNRGGLRGIDGTPVTSLAHEAAAGPNAPNTPAPIIEPKPMTTASPVPSWRAKAGAAPAGDPPGRRQTGVDGECAESGVVVGYSTHPQTTMRGPGSSSPHVV